MADKNDTTKSTPNNSDDSKENPEQPAKEIGSFMDRAMEVSERLLREHKEREDKKRNAEDKNRNHS